MEPTKKAKERKPLMTRLSVRWHAVRVATSAAEVATARDQLRAARARHNMAVMDLRKKVGA